MNEAVVPRRLGKRVMTPAIENMSVKEERQCLSEIRKLGDDIDDKHLLSNGWTTGRFALMYVTGQHIKRKTKAKENAKTNALNKTNAKINNTNTNTKPGKPYILSRHTLR
ncbi:unnamed protein product [Pylaiella littoralis]